MTPTPEERAEHIVQNRFQSGLRAAAERNIREAEDAAVEWVIETFGTRTMSKGNRNAMTAADDARVTVVLADVEDIRRRWAARETT